MANGEIVAEGTLDELEKSRKGRTITVISDGDYVEIKEILSELEGVDYVITYPRGDYVKSVIETKEGFDGVQDDITSVLEENGIAISQLITTRVSIEDIFIRLTTEAAVKKAQLAKESESVGTANNTDKPKKEYDPLAAPYLVDEPDEPEETAEDEADGEYTSLFSEDEADEEAAVDSVSEETAKGDAGEEKGGDEQ